MEVSNDPAANKMFISRERIFDKNGTIYGKDQPGVVNLPGYSIFSTSQAGPERVREIGHVADWQFLSLAPERMGMPILQRRTAGGVRLARDGSNIADFLLDLRQQDANAFNGIVETMTYVLPYARDLQPSVTSELERKAYLQLTEADFKIPGWMLSTGTLRMLALLALLRHPNPPPLIVVEEIENGLDPRSIHLLVEEIRTAVLTGVTQVVLTTHSPYLLDLLKLEHLVLVERNFRGEPRFSRPANNERLQAWAQEFAPGKLYTMGSLSEAPK